jgi:hypothetical protein
MKMKLSILSLLLLQAGAVFAQDLHCVTRYRNSLAGPVSYTDCGSGEVALYEDGISWFYNRSRMDRFFDQKADEKVYNREFLLRTGLTPAEVDKIIAARDTAAAGLPRQEEMNPEKANLNALQFEASELFVYSSTSQQKGLVDAYYKAFFAPKQIAERTTPAQKEELRRKLDKMIPDLAALKELAGAALAYDGLQWGMAAADLKKTDPDITEVTAGLCVLSRVIAGVPARFEFRFLDGKLISAGLSFGPPGLPQAELEQLRLLISAEYGWPASCRTVEDGELSCAWTGKSGVDIDTAGVNRGGEPQELSVTLTSRKLVDELAGVKSGAAGQ